MIELKKRVETYIADTEQEAEKFIIEQKEDLNKEGYEVKGYKLTKKEKKAKGEIIDTTFEISITKAW